MPQSIIHFPCAQQTPLSCTQAIDLFIVNGAPKPSISRMHSKFNELAFNELIGQYGALANTHLVWTLHNQHRTNSILNSNILTEYFFPLFFLLVYWFTLLRTSGRQSKLIEILSHECLLFNYVN